MWNLHTREAVETEKKSLNTMERIKWIHNAKCLLIDKNKKKFINFNGGKMFFCKKENDAGFPVNRWEWEKAWIFFMQIDSIFFFSLVNLIRKNFASN